jgi:TrmH family RNA methyltransferase
VLADPRPAPLVLLEDPRGLGNIGWCVRTAAGADAAGVITTGVHDPWNQSSLRVAAGLQFALPVARASEEQLDALSGPARERPLVALDTAGETVHPELIPARAILAFGTERQGLSETILQRADAHVRLPMREGVSSLNLATAVAAVLYAWRLSAGRYDL